MVDRLYHMQCHNAHNDEYCVRAMSAHSHHRGRASSLSNAGPIVYVYHNDQGHEVRETIYEADEEDEEQEEDRDRDWMPERDLGRASPLEQSRSFVRRFSDDSNTNGDARKRKGSNSEDSADSDAQ